MRCVFFIIALFTLVSAGASSLAAAERVVVVTANAVLDDLTRRIGGERIVTTCLVPPDGDTHHYRPTPDDARRLVDADAIVINGLGYEGWFDALLARSQSRARVIIAAAGIAPLPLAAGSRCRDDRGGTLAAADALDPHAFHSLVEGLHYVDAIRSGLTAIDPAGADHYAANASTLSTEIRTAHQWAEATLSAIPLRRRIIITSHDALAYFARDYGFTVVGIGNSLEDRQASARDLVEMVRTIRAEQIPAIFREHAKAGALIDRVAQEAGVVVAGALYLDGPDAGDPAVSGYLAMFRANVRLIASALQ